MDIADILSTADLPSPPRWAIEMLLERHTRSTVRVQWDVHGQPTPVHKDALLANEQGWFEGRDYVKQPDGSVDRSMTLFNIGRIAATKGHDGASIVATLADRDRVLGYNKYSVRRDGGEKAYNDIAQKVLTTPASQSSAAQQTPGQAPPTPPETTALRGRKGELYALRKLFAQSIFRAGCDEDFTTSPEGGKVAILLENPCLYPSHASLMSVVTGVPEVGQTKLEKFAGCGSLKGLSCPSHGERRRTRTTCKFPWHPECPTDTTNKLARMALPDLDGPASYREVWIDSNFRMDEEQLRLWIGRWSQEVKKLSHRKAVRGKILARSYSFYLGNTAQAHWKIMLQEEFDGELDWAVQLLMQRMGSIFSQQRRYAQGETALLQLMEDSMMSLVGIGFEDVELFRAYYQATKGRHGFQSMGPLFNSMEDVPKPEPAKCDVEGCDERLVLTDIQTSSPTMGQGSQTPRGPDPPTPKRNEGVLAPCNLRNKGN
jgi:hypothetical protein